MSLSRRSFTCFVAATIAAGVLRVRPVRAGILGRRLEADLTPVIEQTIETMMNMMLVGALIAIPILLFAALAELIAEKLKLTDTQKGRLADLGVGLLADIQSRKFTLDGKNPGQIREFLKSIEPKYVGKIEAILTPKQHRRWKEILLQFQGARGITTPDIGKQLGLGAEQTAKVQELVAAFDKDVPAKFSGWLPALKLVGTKAQLDRAAKATLTKEQSDKLNALQGESVELLSASRLLGIVQELAPKAAKK